MLSKIFKVFLVFFVLGNAQAITIEDLTPVKPEMTLPEATDAIRDFLKTVLTSDNRISMEEIEDVSEVKMPSGRLCTRITLADGTQWIQGTGGLERFLGALYLNKALDVHPVSRFRAVKTKFLFKPAHPGQVTVKIADTKSKPCHIFTINSGDFICLSQYVGDVKPDVFGGVKVSELTLKTGFSDTAGFANFRVTQDNTITVIDTEYHSFDNGIREHLIIPAPSPDQITELGNKKITFNISEIFPDEK